MISVKIASIIAVAAFAAGGFVMSPVPQAIAAVIATDVQCTGCVGTADLAGNAVTAAKIKDGEVRAPEIAANAVGSSEIAMDAVGAPELQGVTKLQFAKCVLTATEATTDVSPGTSLNKQCNITGVTNDDQAVATYYNGVDCLAVGGVDIGTDKIFVTLQNTCNFTIDPGNGFISVIVYHK